MLVGFRTALALILIASSSHAALAAKKKTPAPVKKTAVKTTAVRKTSARLPNAPTADRYREIQEALASKGYLAPTQANGQWNDASVDALKHFQSDQKIDSTGRINALSLIALGLGPKREAAGSSTGISN